MINKSLRPMLIAVILLIGVMLWENSSPFIQIDQEYPPSVFSTPLESSNLKSDSNPLALELKQEIKLTLLGDIMCHPTQYQTAQVADSYDFAPSFYEIQAYTSQADLTLANLETTLAGKDKIYSGYPSFNSPEQIAQAIKEILGVDVVSTANNHSLDRHYTGLCRTIDFLDHYGIGHSGTYKTIEDSRDILIQDVKGLSIAFLSYTYGTNGVTLPPEKSFAVNYINRDKIKQDANKAKTLGADLIIASIHWGQEYSNVPSTEQKSLARWIFSNTDVNIISGNHVHTIQPIEFISMPDTDTGMNKEGLVIYAQGNFISDQKTDSANMGILVDIVLDYDLSNKQVSVKQVRYSPTWIDETPEAGLKTYRVLQVEKALSDFESGVDPLLDQKDYDEMLRFKGLVKKVIPMQDRIIYQGSPAI